MSTSILRRDTECATNQKKRSLGCVSLLDDDGLDRVGEGRRLFALVRDAADVALRLQVALHLQPIATFVLQTCHSCRFCGTHTSGTPKARQVDHIAIKGQADLAETKFQSDKTGHDSPSQRNKTVILQISCSCKKYCFVNMRHRAIGRKDLPVSSLPGC